jgi:hypothetical protein
VMQIRQDVAKPARSVTVAFPDFHKALVADFPGMCFASTRCATVEPGKTWELHPFCGRSTCVVSEDKPPRLLELVEDCGPLPLANPKCKLDEGNRCSVRCRTRVKLFFQKRPTKLLPSPDAVHSSSAKREPSWSILRFRLSPQSRQKLDPQHLKLRS